ncbi:MAG: glycosyltransferase family 25 protein, partial [Pseudomonadota bacterium]
MKPIVINLEKRTDRLEQFDKQAKQMGFEYELFKAIPATDNPYISNAHYGCFLSHKAILERRETMFIMEDDCLLNNYFDWIDVMMKELPDDWDLLYLGGWKQQVTYYSQHLQIADRVLTTHAYIVRDKFCDVLLKQMETPDKIDLIFARTPGKKFICNPILATQR